MLGPFEISEIIGTGAMGDVWKARHGTNGNSAAIKVLRSQFAGDRRYMEGFHQEVRAIARVDHPGIVQVYDHGLITEEVARRHESLEAGGLWLAMEFAEGGSLEQVPPRLSWLDLRNLLLQVLDALSHAHARSLVHRDLKPANVLRRPAGKNQQFDQWILSDFGIAHVRDPNISAQTGDILSAAAGTPHFMAPEQLHGEWRDYGPWTDLYALGCMAYLLASGEPPFTAESLMGIAVKHLSEPVPELKSILDVPPGFENWTRRLLAKDIHRRYRRAADAAADLVLLGDAEPTGGGEPRDSSRPVKVDSQTLDAFQTQTLTHLPEAIQFRTRHLDEEKLNEVLASDNKSADSQHTTPHPEQSPLRVRLPPTSWQTDHARRRRTIPATGKGIFGLRQPPYVGRTEARDHLWREFRRVCEEGKSRLVVIRGQAGLGKSRLMHWLTQRTHELGLANSLITQHSPIMTAADGLPQVIQAYLGATGLDRGALFERLQKTYATHLGEENPDPRHLAAVVEWMSPRAGDDDDQIPVVALESPLERFMLAETLVGRVANQRPLVFGIDDSQWAQETLGLVQHILTHRSENPLPVLFVATLRPSGLKNRLMEREYLELLLDHEAASVVDLTPLSDDDERQLIEYLLGLEDGLVERINAVAGGVPLFAVQLIEDWVARDVLRDSPEGYILASGVELPDDLDTLLDDRISDIADRWKRPREAQIAMETAAALGIDIEYDEWQHISEKLGATVDDGLLDHLMLHGLAMPHPGGWRMRLPLYRDRLEAISRQGRRWQWIHSMVAHSIDSSTENGTCLAERRARHLLAAGQRDEAIPLLWRAVDFRMQRSAYIQSQALLSVLEASFDESGIDPHHPDRYRLKIRRSEAYRFRGDLSHAQSLIDEVLVGDKNFDDQILAEAHRVAASLATFKFDFQASIEHYQLAHDTFESIGDIRGLARSLHGLGWIYTCLDQLDRAFRAYETGFERADAAGHKLQAAWCLNGMGSTSIIRENFEGVEYTRRAHALFDELGCRSGMAIAGRTLGDHARLIGDTTLARQHYEQTRHLATMIGHVLSEFTNILIAFCDLVDGDIDTAYRRFTEFTARVPETKLPLFRPVGNLGLFVTAAHRRDNDRFDELAAVLRNQLSPNSPVKRDYIYLLEEAIAGCEKHGDDARRAVASELMEILTHRREVPPDR